MHIYYLLACVPHANCREACIFCGTDRELEAETCSALVWIYLCVPRWSSNLSNLLHILLQSEIVPGAMCLTAGPGASAIFLESCRYAVLASFDQETA